VPDLRIPDTFAGSSAGFSETGGAGRSSLFAASSVGLLPKEAFLLLKINPFDPGFVPLPVDPELNSGFFSSIVPPT
jgi:hypothetical protein